MDGSVRLQEVGLEEHLEPISGKTFNRVVDGQNVDPLSVLDIRALCHRYDIAETHAQIVTNDAIHSNLFCGDGVVAKNDTDGLLSFLSFEQDQFMPRDLLSMEGG